MKHYEALELPATAPAADIRSAYRRLVLLTHPDRTPDPAAHARYLAINAAYEVLSDPARRATYDSSFRVNTATVNRAASSGRVRDEARRVTRARQPRPAVIPLTVRYAAEYAFSLRLARPFMLLALLLVASLAVDFVLASKAEEKVLRTETMVYYTGSRRSRQSHVYFRHHTERGSFDADDNVPVGSTLLVERTPIWRIATAVRNGGLPAAFDAVYSFVNSIMLLLLVGLSGFALRPTSNADHRLSAAMLATVLLGAVLYRMVL